MVEVAKTLLSPATGEPFPAKTVRNKQGDILLFSWDDFVAMICEGPCCFICGAAPGERAFNAEHIVPNWVLHTYALHDKKVTLPNGQQHKYGTYKVPCCAECNTALGDTLETPLSKAVAEGAGAIQKFIAKNGPLLPFTWMALIFLKIHLKDRHLKWHLDRRKGEEPISENYVWEHMHHLHQIARASRIGAEVKPEAVGSMFVFPVRDDGTRDAFDLATFTEAQTLYVRLGGTGIIAVFNDACAATNRIGAMLEKLDFALSWAQAREVAACMALANLDLENRPQFWSRISLDQSSVTIGGKIDEYPRFRDVDAHLFGALKASVFPSLPPIEGYTSDEAETLLRSGKLTFLYDDSGNLIREHKPHMMAAEESDRALSAEAKCKNLTI